MEANKGRWLEVELHRLKGGLLLAHFRPDLAEACFRRAIDVAREQGARMWELRPATSLARLWQDSGRHIEAHDLPAPIRGRFTEGSDAPDLVEAKRLILGLGRRARGRREL